MLERGDGWKMIKTALKELRGLVIETVNWYNNAGVRERKAAEWQRKFDSLSPGEQCAHFYPITEEDIALINQGVLSNEEYKNLIRKRKTENDSDGIKNNL